jgi:hypothetical protein
MLKLLTNASPAVTAVSPVSILKVVVLPAPLTPSRPKHSARPTPKVSRLTATRSYFFTRFRTYIKGLCHEMNTLIFLKATPKVNRLTATRSYFFTRFRTYICNLYNLLCTSPSLPPSPPLSQCHFAICLLQESVLLSQE